MSIKHVKNYYKQVEKMYLELVKDLSDMEADFKEGKVTEEELNKFLTPVNSIKDNYIRLSYILYLLMQPNRDSKQAKYHKQNKDLYNYFNNNNLTAEKERDQSYDALKEFKRLIAEKKNEQ